MKNITKCYIYFGVVFAFCLLNILNYFMTHNTDGFKRFTSLGLQLPDFYCFKDHQVYLQCQHQHKSKESQDQYCGQYKKLDEECNKMVKDKEQKVIEECWQIMYDLYNCKLNFEEQVKKKDDTLNQQQVDDKDGDRILENENNQDQFCSSEIEWMYNCIKKVVEKQ